MGDTKPVSQSVLAPLEPKLSTLDTPPDLIIWQKYNAARETGDKAAQNRYAGLFVEQHLGYLITYANENAFPSWKRDPEKRRRYLHELVAKALEVLPNYDPLRPGHGGRTATFPTYVKRYLREVAWIVAAKEDQQIPMGKSQLRLKARVEGIARARWHETGEMPTFEELAAEVSRLEGRGVSAARVATLLDPLTIIRGDESSTDSDDGAEKWEHLRCQRPTPEEHYVSLEERREVVSEVTSILASLELTDLEHDIITDRWMADSPVEHLELAHRHQLVKVVTSATLWPDERADQLAVTTAERAALRHVRKVEASLQQRLAGLLAHLR